MTRPLRIDVQNGIAHITARGNNRRAIFGSPEQRDRLVGIIQRVVARYGWLCHAYVVMDNHYHLLLETPIPNLSLGMRQLNGLYGQWFNHRHDRSGHVFGGRFKSIVVERDAHFLEAARYIVLNPLRTDRPRRFTDWRWSSYPATAGLVPSPPFLTTTNVLGAFGPDLVIARQRYVTFVSEGVASSLDSRLVGEIYLGDEQFIRDLMPGESIADFPRTQWQPLRPNLEVLLAERGGVLAAYRNYGYRLREIAAQLGVSPATVSRALARLEQAAAHTQASRREERLQ